MTTPRPRAGAVLVTGSASGIGAATALRLAADGHDVVATVRTLDNAAHLATSASARGVQLDVRPVDVTDEDAMRSTVAEIVSDHSGLAAVIHNAGVAHLDVFETESMSEFRRVFEINFLGAVALTKLALPHLRASRGRIIALSSVGGVIGQPFNEAYCSAKFALEGLVEAMAPVLRSVGVLVSLIEPGPVHTNLAAGVDVPARMAAAGPYGDAFRAFIATASNPRPEQRTPFRDAQQPEEIAELVARVLSDPHPALRYQTSPNAADFARIKLTDLDGSAVGSLLDSWLGPGRDTQAGSSP